MLGIFAIAALLWTGARATDDAAAPEGRAGFDDCGLLIQGITCPLFQSDHFGTLFVGFDLQGFQIGDRVRVTGIPDPGCITVCLEGNGCVLDAVITACGPTPVQESDWGRVKARYR
jgi:hypothetical protein